MYPASNSSSTRPSHSLPEGSTPMLSAAPRTATYGAGCLKICFCMCFNIPQALSLILRTSSATTVARLSGGSRVPSAVYLPYLPPAFSPSALLALSLSLLSLLPVLAAACLFRALSSPAVCPALPSLLPAGAPHLRPPGRRPQRRRSRLKRL